MHTNKQKTTRINGKKRIILASNLCAASLKNHSTITKYRIKLDGFTIKQTIVYCFPNHGHFIEIMTINSLHPIVWYFFMYMIGKCNFSMDYFEWILKMFQMCTIKAPFNQLFNYHTRGKIRSTIVQISFKRFSFPRHVPTKLFNFIFFALRNNVIFWTFARTHNICKLIDAHNLAQENPSKCILSIQKR